MWTENLTGCFEKVIEDNWEAALEYNSEAFGSVVMLYVDMKVHGHPLKIVEVIRYTLQRHCSWSWSNRDTRLYSCHSNQEEDISGNFLDEDRYGKEASSLGTQETSGAMEKTDPTKGGPSG
ncbi:hypothetical protein HAX54_045100 [Datura stramonium]|uniref:Uncharacterized protein n=1 Tax=Datura stramonium TaxID=4076 RepID=A0ABS8SPZ7_DATST|nr:hypothetical protein [Datura stramonium]